MSQKKKLKKQHRKEARKEREQQKAEKTTLKIAFKAVSKKFRGVLHLEEESVNQMFQIAKSVV